MASSIDIVRIARYLIKKIWIIILITLIAGIAGIVYTAGSVTNVYMAEASLYSVAYGSYQASMQGTNIMKDYAEIAQSKKVANRVINALQDYSLDADMIKSMVNTNIDENSAIFRVDASSSNPQLAVAVANAVAEAFVQEVSNITGADNVKILDEASSVSLSYNGDSEQMKTRLIFLGGGFLLICVILSLVMVFSTKVKEVNDCTLNGEIRLIGVIPKHSI